MIENSFKDKIVERLTEKGVNCERCMACSKKTLTLASYLGSNRCVEQIGNGDVSEVDVGYASAMFVCDSCGYLAQYALKVLGLLGD